LAIPVFQLAEPIAAPKLKFRGKEFDLWSKLEIRKGDLILSDLLEYFKKRISNGSRRFEHQCNDGLHKLDAKREIERKNGPKSYWYCSNNAKKPLDQQYFQLSVTGSDAEGNEIEDMPDVFYYWK